MAGTTPKKGSVRFRGKISSSLFVPSKSDSSSSANPKKVSFNMGANNESRVEMNESTPSPSNQASNKKTSEHNVTPHPRGTTMKAQKRAQTSSPSHKKTGVAGSQKRRKTKKLSYSLFSTTPTVPARPNNTLTAQLSFVLEALPEKLNVLRNDKKRCQIEVINDLAKIEDDIMKRLTKVGSMKFRSSDNVLDGKRTEVMDEMQDKITEVQKLKEKKETHLHQIRLRLRFNHNGNFVCCPVCEANSKSPR